MTEVRGAGYVLAPLYAVAAPVLVMLMIFTLVASAVSRAMFGTDPAAKLIEEHSAGWAIVKLTGGCTLGLLLAAGLLGLAI
jgi:hypothetical protein